MYIIGIDLFDQNADKALTYLSEVLQPITIMDLIGNWEFRYSHKTALFPDVAYEYGHMIHLNHI